MVKITFLNENDGEWFDLGLKNVVRGTLHSFRVDDEKSGQWILNVRVHGSGNKADVIVATSEKVSSLHDQIKRKTTTFNETVDSTKFYNVLGFGHVDIDDKRFHSERTFDMNKIPEEIKSKFEIKKYDEVSRYKNLSLKNKLVAVIGKDKIEDMILLFYLQKIKPVFN